MGCGGAVLCLNKSANVRPLVMGGGCTIAGTPVRGPVEEYDTGGTGNAAKVRYDIGKNIAVTLGTIPFQMESKTHPGQASSWRPQTSSWKPPMQSPLRRRFGCEFGFGRRVEQMLRSDPLGPECRHRRLH